MKKFIFKSELLGQLAHWAVRQSSYVPDYISALLIAANEYIRNSSLPVLTHDGNDIMYEYTDVDLYEFIRTMVHTVPEIAILNLRKEEIEAGLTAIDDVIGERGKRFRPADKNSSFVDLGALARNITNSIERDYQWNIESDKRIFDKINYVEASDDNNRSAQSS